MLASGANFSCEVLHALIQRNQPPALLALPEYPPAARQDRELIETTTSRQLLRLAAGIESAYVPAERQHQFAAEVCRLEFEFLLVACWPYLISPQLIDSPRGATLNLHPSLLPAYRGANPVRQQLAAGDHRYGVSLHLLNQQFDQGDIVAQAPLQKPPANLQPALIERECARLGVDLFITAMADFPRWQPTPQSS